MQANMQGWATECPDVKNCKWRLNPVWHRMLYGCTHIATVGVKGLWCDVIWYVLCVACQVTRSVHYRFNYGQMFIDDVVSWPPWGGGYRGGSPTAVRPSDPALCGSCPLVTPYYGRLGDLLSLFGVYPILCVLFYVHICDLVVFALCFFLCSISFSTLILLVGSFDL